MAIVEISIVPLGTQSPSVSPYVAACHQVLNNFPQLKVQLTPMSTIIEGELTLILQVVKELHEVPFTKGAKRVLTSIKIDERRDKELTMDGKIASVEEKLNK